MSQKTGKKLRKRVDDEVEACVKIPKIEINNKPLEDIDTVGNGVAEEVNAEERKVNVDVNMGEPDVNGTNDNESQVSNKSSEQTSQNKVENSEETVQTIVIVEDKVINNTASTSETEISSIQDEQNQSKDKQPQKEVQEIESANTEQTESKTDNAIEPIILETEDVDPELQFDENSDLDSQRSSPLRCTTRRSHTRNLPTPKTPKIFDSISDDKEPECPDKPLISTVPTPEVTDTESEVSVFKAVTDIYDTNEELTPKINDDLDSLPNISTKAIVGSDTTRNIDFSSYTDGEFELSPFLVQSREKSVGQTLKLLSSRRSIKTVRDYTLPNNSKKDYKTFLPFPRRETTENISTKRKNHSDSTDYSKRFKPEPPSGLFSYFSSPISNIKNRISNKSDIPSSTPKLTSYKSKSVFDNTNMSKISLNETEESSEKKWCTIM